MFRGVIFFPPAEEGRGGGKTLFSSCLCPAGRNNTGFHHRYAGPPGAFPTAFQKKVFQNIPRHAPVDEGRDGSCRRGRSLRGPLSAGAKARFSGKLCPAEAHPRSGHEQGGFFPRLVVAVDLRYKKTPFINVPHGLKLLFSGARRFHGPGIPLLARAARRIRREGRCPAHGDS